MRNLIFLLLLINIYIFAYPDSRARKELELFIVVDNIDDLSGDGLFFKLTCQQSFVHKFERGVNNRTTITKSTNCSLLAGTFPYDAPGEILTNIITEDSPFPNDYDWGGFNFYGTSSEDDGDYCDFAYGLYKLTAYMVEWDDDSITELDGAFYLDMRDSHYPGVDGYSYYGSNDFFFLYDCDTQEFRTSEFYEPSSVSGFDNSISEDELVQIWDLATLSTPDNSIYPSSFWDDCLLLLNKNSKVWLIWGEHPTMSVTSYKLYRSVTSNHNGKYTVVETTANNSTFDYLDNNTSYWHQEGRHYYVKAYNGSYSSATDIVSTPVNKMPKSVEFGDANEICVLELKQNHPNPFNPSTTISYQIPKNGYVTLKVFNTLGKEVAVLEDGFKNAGSYNVSFNADNLPSGMYFYTITSGAYSETKKMVLLR